MSGCAFWIPACSNDTEPNDTEPNDTDSTTPESATGTDRPSDSTTDAGNCNCGRPFAPPDTSATKPLIHLTANLETILGLQSRAAYLHGNGHLDPTTLRTLAQDATWQVIFTVGRKCFDALTTSARCSVPDPPTGTESAHSPHCTCPCTCGAPPSPAATADLLNQATLLNRAAAEHDAVASMLPTRMTTPSALRYTPSAALAQWVRAQYPTCRFPGCAVQSSRCDLDHIVGFDHKNPEQGGWTISSNLAPFCRTHHNLKTSRLWTIEKLPDDVLHITDPHGNHYFSPPEL